MLSRGALIESSFVFDRAPLTPAIRGTQGPLVGDMTPSHVITEQYAAADPVYVEKTLVSLCVSRSGSMVANRAPTRPCRKHTLTIDPYGAMATADGEVSFMQYSSLHFSSSKLDQTHWCMRSTTHLTGDGVMAPLAQLRLISHCPRICSC